MIWVFCTMWELFFCLSDFTFNVGEFKNVINYLFDFVLFQNSKLLKLLILTVI